MSEAHLRRRQSVDAAKGAAEISDMFFRASGSERALICTSLA